MQILLLKFLEKKINNLAINCRQEAMFKTTTTANGEPSSEDEDRGFVELPPLGSCVVNWPNPC